MKAFLFLLLWSVSGSCSGAFGQSTGVSSRDPKTSALRVLAAKDCLDNPTLPDYAGSTVVIEAETTITATNKISLGAIITYQAGNTVNLHPGFRADSGSIFVAQTVDAALPLLPI